MPIGTNITSPAMHINNDPRKNPTLHIPSVPESDMTFETARSSGPGGQNVNKVETKVRVVFDLWASPAFTYEQKGAIVRSPGIQRHIRSDGRIAVSSQTHRSQAMNKEEAMRKLHALITDALTPEKERVATLPPSSVERERQWDKEHRTAKKEGRRSDHSKGLE